MLPPPRPLRHVACFPHKVVGRMCDLYNSYIST